MNKLPVTCTILLSYGYTGKNFTVCSCYMPFASTFAYGKQMHFVIQIGHESVLQYLIPPYFERAIRPSFMVSRTGSPFLYYHSSHHQGNEFFLGISTSVSQVGLLSGLLSSSRCSTKKGLPSVLMPSSDIRFYSQLFELHTQALIVAGPVLLCYINGKLVRTLFFVFTTRLF